MKIEWMNNGQAFEIPKITVDMDIEILGYMETLDKKLLDSVKTILEFKETVYRVFNKIDKNVTRELIGDKLSTNELGVLYTVIRTQGRLKYICPYCDKSFTHEQMKEEKKEGDIPLSESKPDDSTGMNDKTS